MQIIYPLSHLGNPKDKYTELQAGNVIHIGLRFQFVECFLMSCAPQLVLALSGPPHLGVEIRINNIKNTI